MGADRRLARWGRICDYFRSIAERSDRLLYNEYGQSWGGQPLVLLTLSSPENLARLDEFRHIQDRLFDPRQNNIPDHQQLIRAGRSVCVVTCSIHATEVGPTQLTPELVYDLVTSKDPTVNQMLNDVILLLVPCLNPAGLEQVADWYERTLGTPYEGTPPPDLYHPYAGHDNNRDWFMLTQTETRATVEAVLNPWHPHIVFDLHQMQINGPRFVLPPYIDPYDPNVDPLTQAQIDALGTSVAADLVAHGRHGVATSVIFDAYSPARAYPHYHGGVRILAEAASARIASPIDVSADLLVETRGFDPRAPSHLNPIPWAGGTWRLRDIVDYTKDAVLSLLDHAARYRDRWITNFASIQQRAVTASSPAAYLLLPLNYQRDPHTAWELLQTLRLGGVEIGIATDQFEADGVAFPTETFVIALAQPAGRFAKTLLEIQHYPVHQLFPGGPPKAPYDITAHSLPLMMGVDAVRIESPLSVSHVPAPASAPLGIVSIGKTQQRFAITPESNNSVLIANQLLSAGAAVARTPRAFIDGEHRFPAGTYVVTCEDRDQVERIADQSGVSMVGLDGNPPDAISLRTPRLGVYRSARPNAIDEGWTRYVLERYEFHYQSVRDADMKRGDLFARFDVIVLPQQAARDILEGNSASEYPIEFAGGIGDAGAANLRRFVESGGTLIALDSSCDLAIRQLYLPVTNVLEGVRTDVFSAPGSILRILIDADHAIGWGFEREAAAMFVSSPAFEVRGSAQVVAQYPLTNQLLSGWLQGGDLLAGRAAIVEVPVGQGRAILIGFRPQFRAQTRGTYRILFNAILSAGLQP